jgi:hypothetical protein
MADTVYLTLSIRINEFRISKIYPSKEEKPSIPRPK